jgi:hypothetical protein
MRSRSSDRDDLAACGLPRQGQHRLGGEAAHGRRLSARRLIFGESEEMLSVPEMRGEDAEVLGTRGRGRGEQDRPDAVVSVCFLEEPLVGELGVPLHTGLEPLIAAAHVGADDLDVPGLGPGRARAAHREGAVGDEPTLRRQAPVALAEAAPQLPLVLDAFEDEVALAAQGDFQRDQDVGDDEVMGEAGGRRRLALAEGLGVDERSCPGGRRIYRRPEPSRRSMVGAKDDRHVQAVDEPVLPELS